MPRFSLTHYRLYLCAESVEWLISMASRLIALVEHPAQERTDSRVEVETRRRIGKPEAG